MIKHRDVQSDLRVRRFSKTYDASTRMRPKIPMSRLGISSLMIGNVVVVECLCVKTCSGRGQEVAFELQSLMLVGQINRDVER